MTCNRLYVVKIKRDDGLRLEFSVQSINIELCIDTVKSLLACEYTILSINDTEYYC